MFNSVPSSVAHCRCPVTELDGHSQVRSTRRSHPYIRLHPVGAQNGTRLRDLDAVPSHHRTGNSTDGFHNGYVARVNAHAPGARPPRDGTL